MGNLSGEIGGAGWQSQVDRLSHLWLSDDVSLLNPVWTLPILLSLHLSRSDSKFRVQATLLLSMW
jgi:hypothetical protein